jgi:hypothetical protein
MPTTELAAALGAQAVQVNLPMDVVRAVVAFANGDVAPAPKQFVPTQQGRHLYPDQYYYRWYRALGGKPLLGDETEAIAEQFISFQQQYAREVLGHAAQGTAQLLQWIETMFSQDGYTGVSQYITLYRRENNRPKLRWEMAGPSSPQGWINYAATIIAATADEKGEQQTCVGQCKWKQCGRFFLVDRKGKGKPARYYCPRTDHRERAKAESDLSTGRVQKLRIRRAEARAITQRRRKPAKGK